MSDPPLVVPVEELFESIDPVQVHDMVGSALRATLESLPDDRRRLMSRYRYVDLARKVVGVGSVGTRAWIALMMGRDQDDPLLLQAKEAEASVLERFAGRSPYENHGRRVVEGQRLMQAASDIFLGWVRTIDPAGVPRDFYVRQLWDWKLSADVDTMNPSLLADYVELCGWALANAHARSGDPVAIAAYLGSGTAFDRAIAEFAQVYADQNELDYQALLDAIANGEVEARTGV